MIKQKFFMTSSSVLGNTHSLGMNWFSCSCWSHSACLFYDMQCVPLNSLHFKVLSWILARTVFIDEFLISANDSVRACVFGLGRLNFQHWRTSSILFFY